MPSLLAAYAFLGIAIVAEVTGSSLLQRTEQFTKLGPSLITALCYGSSFYLLSLTLKVLPLGIAYAIWGGLGIVLTALAGVVLYKQALDLWALVGIAMIVGGVVVMNVLSKTVSH